MHLFKKKHYNSRINVVVCIRCNDVQCNGLRASTCGNGLHAHATSGPGLILGWGLPRSIFCWHLYFTVLQFPDNMKVYMPCSCFILLLRRMFFNWNLESYTCISYLIHVIPETPQLTGSPPSQPRLSSTETFWLLEGLICCGHGEKNCSEVKGFFPWKWCQW